MDGNSNDALDPLAIRIDEAERISGLDRVSLYRTNAKGCLIFRKLADALWLTSLLYSSAWPICPRCMVAAACAEGEGHDRASCATRTRIAGYAHMTGLGRAGHSSSSGMASPLSCDGDGPVPEDIGSTTSDSLTILYSRTGVLTKRVSVAREGWRVVPFSAGCWFSVHVRQGPTALTNWSTRSSG